MKINRLLTAALITFSTVLTGCVKESVWDRETGIDERKAAPEEFTYDEEASSATSMTVYWDGKKAIAAGAKSFLIQLTDPTNMDKGDTWNTTTTKVIEITDDESVDCETTTLTGLKEYDLYYVRIRANYPGSVYSPWVYLARENGTPALYQVGHGAVALVPTISLNALVKDIEVAWTYCEGAVKYRVEWKKSSETAWQSTETEATNYTISGLTPETQYDVKVTSITATAENASDVVSTTTKEQPPYPVEVATADEWLAFINGEIIGLANNGADDKVILTADLDFTGKEYATAATFKGVIDGNGKTIKNLKATTPLIKEVTSVKDLTIDATCSFTSTTSPVLASVAEKTNGVITNVTNNAPVTVTMSAIDAGYVMGGLVAYAYGNIDRCANNGAVSISATFANTGAAGGIVGYTEAQVDNTNNSGNVTVAFDEVGVKVAVVNVTAAPSIGGVVGLAQGNGTFSMTNCTNSGTINYSLKSALVSTGMTRCGIAGIVGSPNGKVEKCTNTGEIIVNLPLAAGVTGKEMIACVGGIGGSDYHATAQGDRPAQSATDYIDCVNEGTIKFHSDVANSNSTCGGIVGWPGVEGAGQVCVTKNCINRGDIILSGLMKGRFGGIQGGAGHIIGCANYGNISANKLNVASPLGGVAGYSSYNFKFENNISECSISAQTAVEAIGGLIGAYAGQNFNGAADCKVNCVISAAAEGQVDFGIVVGQVNGANSMTFGQVGKPIVVTGGSINGTAITSANFSGFLHGTPGHKWSDANHKINAVWGE